MDSTNEESRETLKLAADYFVKNRPLEESREALELAADYLVKNRRLSKQMLFVAGAIYKFLDGEETTLDQAFGFKKERGKYKRTDEPKHIDLVYKALQMRLQGKPWRTISELSGYSEKEFRRLWKRYISQAIQKMVDKQPPIIFD